MAYQFIKRWISWLTIANIAESVKKSDDFHPKSTISAFLFAAPDFIKPDDDIKIIVIGSIGLAIGGSSSEFPNY